MLFYKELYFDQSHFKRFDHVIPDIYNISLRVLMVCKMDTPKRHLKGKKERKKETHFWKQR